LNGAVFGAYRLIRQVGRGGLGVTSERRWKDFESNVTLQFGIAGTVDFAHPAFGKRLRPKLAPDHRLA
jgi:hypothetical protein